MSENGYIQGAADDSESWSCGLTPALFWEYKEQLLGAPEEQMENLILHMIHEDQKPKADCLNALKIGSTNLYIGTLSESTQVESYDAIISCSIACSQIPNSKVERETSTKYLHLPCRDGKLGSRALRSQLPRIPMFIDSLVNCGQSPKILFASSRGKDVSAGTALVVLCLYFDEECTPKAEALQSALPIPSFTASKLTYVMIDDYSTTPPSKPIDKALIRRRLAYITITDPDANPSRSTLQSVHSFLMPRNE